jgi:membrane protein DedA with SNARE-associated domain
LDIQDLITWMESFAVQYGYFGIFLISLFGSSSIFFPIPAPVVIFALGGSGFFSPFWIAVAAGLGATVGEYSAYLVGFGGRKLISEKYKKKMDLLTRLFKRYGTVVIFVFTLTPLPTDLLFIPLGVMRYSVLRIFVPALLGKFFSNLIIVYSGYLSIHIIRDLFGIEGEGTTFLIGIVLAVILLILILLIMFKTNWEKIVEKYLDNKDNEVEKTLVENQNQIDMCDNNNPPNR